MDQSPHKLILAFTNKEVKEFDFGSYLNYPAYKALIDEAYCKKAKVFNGTVVWDDSTDFDSDTLHLESKFLALA